MRGKDWLVQRLAQSAPVSDERWTWATVTTAGGPGLKVKLDGIGDALSVDTNMFGWCAVGDQVRVHRYRRRLFVVGRKSTDTDWTDLDLEDGLVAQAPSTPQYRLDNGEVRMRWGITSDGLTASSSSTATYDNLVASLPWAPGITKYFSIWASIPQYAVGCYVTSGANLYVRLGPDIPPYMMFDAVRFAPGS